MKFNQEQFNTLSAYEQHFRTAVYADWARYPGSQALSVIHRIFTTVTGDTRRLNDNCNHCILSLLKDCGRLYFQDKTEMEVKAAADAARKAAQAAEEAAKAAEAVKDAVESAEPAKEAEVAVSPAPAKKVRKTVKTKK